MKVMEAISKGFGIAGKNFGVLVILFVFNAVWNLATLPFVGNLQPNLANLQISAQMIILGVVFMLMNIFVQAGVLGLLKDAIGSDGKAALGNFAKYGRKFYLRFLGLGLSIILIILSVALVAGLVFSIALVLAKNAAAAIILTIFGVIIGAIALYCIIFILLPFLSFLPYILVVEDIGIFKTMGNSFRFLKSHSWKIIGLLIPKTFVLILLLILIALGISFIIGIVMGLLSLAFKIPNTAFQIATGIISSGVNSYLTVIIGAALMIYYSALSGAARSK